MVGGSQPARSTASSTLLGQPAEQALGDAFEETLAHPPGRCQLVGVAGDAGGRQLVDVGEHQLGERDERSGVHPVAYGGRGHVAPGDAGTDPVRREEGLRRAAAASLATAELIGALDGRCRRRTWTGAVAHVDEGQEATESEAAPRCGWSHPWGR